MRKLSDEGLQVLAPLLRGMNVSEEVSQCIREELVTKVMKWTSSSKTSRLQFTFCIIIQQQNTIFPSKTTFWSTFISCRLFFLFIMCISIYKLTVPLLFSSKMNKFHGIDIHSLVEVIKLHILYIKKKLTVHQDKAAASSNQHSGIEYKLANFLRVGPQEYLWTWSNRYPEWKTHIKQGVGLWGKREGGVRFFTRHRDLVRSKAIACPLSGQLKLC